jgi:hypothetical protein
MGKLLGLFPVLALREELIDLMNKVLVGSNMIQETLGNENTPVVFTLVGSLSNDIANATDDIDQGFTSAGALFGDNDEVGVSLHGAFKDQMGGISTHKSNEVPVLDG